MQEFESILLKKLIYSGEFFGKTVPILKKKYFTDIGNQELFGLIQQHFKEYRAIPSLTELVASVKNVSNSEVRAEIIKSLQVVNKTEEVQNTQFMCDETVSWVKDAIKQVLHVNDDVVFSNSDNTRLNIGTVISVSKRTVMIKYLTRHQQAQQ